MVVLYVNRKVMANRPPPAPPTSDLPDLVRAIEVMAAAMQQQHASMVEQHNLSLQQMETARAGA